MRTLCQSALPCPPPVDLLPRALRHPVRRHLAALALALAWLFPISPVPGAELLPPGHRPVPLGVHALVGGKVVTKPGIALDPAVIVIRDGIIVAVGPDVKPPADARIWDMKGTTIYAGFIDPYLSPGGTNNPVSTTETDPIHRAHLTSGGINFFGAPGQKTDRGNSGPGYEISQMTPEYRVVQSYVPDAKALETLRELGFTSGNIVPGKGILRGTSALVALANVNPNDAIIKADVFQHVAFETHDSDENSYPGSLMGVIAAVRQAFFDAQHHARDNADYLARPTARVRPEVNLALAALAPALDQRQPVVFEPGSSLMVDRAARVARELGLKFYLCASGQEWRRPELVKSAAAPFIVPVNFPAVPKMPEEDDWASVSLDQFRAWDWAPENPALLRQQGVEIALTTHGLADRKSFRKNLQLALDRGLSENDALAALTTTPARLCGVEVQLGTIESGKIANLTVVEGSNYFDPEAKVREVWIDGRIYAGKTGPKITTANSQEIATDPAKDKKDQAEKIKKATERREFQKKRVAKSPLEGRGPLASFPVLLIRGATIWTCGPQGILTNTDVLIRDGKIAALGRDLLKGEISGGKPAFTIEAAVWHLTPGLIDAHSHTAILGGVNEATLPSSAMVRVSDVVNSETDNLYQQLAGGLTVANLLHGSANPIGGQNCVIKLKDGALPEQLKFKDAPEGIKFALGENVKQSNWGDKNTTRFPQSRMGVPTFIANRFTAAQRYLKAEAAFKKSGGLAPRRDLELEALGEILQGQRWIHCHSYRQDEILSFLRLMEGFNVQVGTLQHVLEGYKIADEIARHGAGGSCFSDWWAYKFEVYDAIPHAGSLMRDRGVLVSFNSDSSELARRMYLEAAKAVKYGGTSEIEALKFVTLNPAKQLRIDQRVGSLEPGKDADFVLWSKSPLDSTTVCLQTWIEGKKYFDRALAADRAAALTRERAELLAKAKKSAALGGGAAAGANDAAQAAFFRIALERWFEGRARHCLDD